MVADYKRRRDYLVKALNSIERISCHVPSGAFYVFPKVYELGMTSEAFAEYLLNQARVATVPGSAFGMNGEGYLRISYSYSMEYLEKAVERIEEAVKNIRR